MISRNTRRCLPSTPTQINDVLSDDLSLTTSLLKQHPKVYCIWTHRQWCLAQVPDGPTDSDPNGWRQAYWNKELFVAEKMLEADPRNCERLPRPRARAPSQHAPQFMPGHIDVTSWPRCPLSVPRPLILPSLSARLSQTSPTLAHGISGRRP